MWMQAVIAWVLQNRKYVHKPKTAFLCPEWLKLFINDHMLDEKEQLMQSLKLFQYISIIRIGITD